MVLADESDASRSGAPPNWLVNDCGPKSIVKVNELMAKHNTAAKNFLGLGLDANIIVVSQQAFRIPTRIPRHFRKQKALDTVKRPGTFRSRC
jgi:hypothetical protein